MMQTGPMETNEASTRVAVATPSNSPKRGILGADLLLRLLAGADLLLRFLAAGATLGGAISMGTTDQSFSLQAFQFRATYNDLPMFMFFVVANSIAGGYLFLSLPVSVFNIIRRTARISKLILIIFDTVVVALLASGASAAAAIAYLAHKGNANANWLAFCQQFDNFCERISGSLIGSFVAVVFLSVMIISSAFALSQNVTIQ